MSIVGFEKLFKKASRKEKLEFIMQMALKSGDIKTYKLIKIKLKKEFRVKL